MIREMKAIGVTPVLITGDNEKAAGEIASEVGIVDVNANCLPEDKLKIIDGYQKKKELVCMIGDGVNDAPALKIASVGIAMGGVGSDIAVDAADIALVDDEIRELPHLFSISHKMMTKNGHNGAGGTYDCIAVLAYYEVMDRKPDIEEIYELNNAVFLPSFRALGKLFNINHPCQTYRRNRNVH